MSALAVNAVATRGAFKLDAHFNAPLDGISALFGPSGAGKSLLLSAIAGLAPLDSGDITLKDRILSDAASHTPPHQRGIGIVFQDARLFPHLNVRGNLQFAAARAPRTLLTLEEAATLFDIQALLDRPVRNLSGGEKSRVALARALLSAPDFLLLDEPFAALDGQRRQSFLDAISAIHRRFALPMLVVTHQIDDAARIAHHLVALRNGQVLTAGPLQQTAASPAFQTLLATRDTGVAMPHARLYGHTQSDSGAAWLRADAVMLAIQAPQGLSARNVWKGQVTEINAEPSARLIRVNTEIGDILARITVEAATELGLSVGAPVWAIVKTHAI